MVDPTGLKPAPHGLKGRRSVTRAPGQKIGCGGRIRTFDSRINNPVPYQLGYATRELAAAARLELAHPRLQDECSVIQLSYAASVAQTSVCDSLKMSIPDFEITD